MLSFIDFRKIVELAGYIFGMLQIIWPLTQSLVLRRKARALIVFAFDDLEVEFQFLNVALLLRRQMTRRGQRSLQLQRIAVLRIFYLGLLFIQLIRYRIVVLFRPGRLATLDQRSLLVRFLSAALDRANVAELFEFGLGGLALQCLKGCLCGVVIGVEGKELAILRQLRLDLYSRGLEVRPLRSQRGFRVSLLDFLFRANCHYLSLQLLQFLYLSPFE